MAVLQQALLAPDTTADTPVPWETIYQQVLTTSSPNIVPTSATFVTRFNDAGQDATHNRYRVTIYTGAYQGTSAGELLALYLGQAASTGDAFDFASSPAPVAVSFSGDSSPIIAFADTTFVSDEITFSGTGADIMIAYALNASVTGLPRQDNQGTIVTYRKAAVSEAGTENKSSYTSNGTNRVALITKVEGRTV